MPVVGCLGGDKESRSADKLSSLSSLCEQFSFLQQCLLLQMFRMSPDKLDTSELSSSSWLPSPCPTCSVFNETCCQVERGSSLFRELINTNLECMWDKTSVEAILALRYQGYVCPGILVLMASDESHLNAVAEAWRRRLLIAPSNCQISQVGLTNGCVVTPVLQSPCINLTDLLCLILARSRSQSTMADMLLEKVEQEWVGARRFQSRERLREAIHGALGQLIRQRRVYYTGKGYFLVALDTSNTSMWPRSSGCRESKRSERSGSSGSNDADQMTSLPLDKSEPSTTSNFERSQSLRLSRKSLIRTMAKGGSLRIARRDVVDAVLSVEHTNERCNGDETRNSSIDNNNVDKVKSNTSSSGSEASVSKSSSPPTLSPSGVKLERKNSGFLVRLFQKSKASTSSSPSSTSSSKSKKPLIRSFSAQFPPQELLESMYASVQRSELRPTKVQHEMTRIMRPAGQVAIEPTYVTVNFVQKPNGPLSNRGFNQRTNVYNHYNRLPPPPPLPCRPNGLRSVAIEPQLPSLVPSSDSSDSSESADKTRVDIAHTMAQTRSSMTPTSSMSSMSSSPNPPSSKRRPPLVDTIHNHKNNLRQEVIYEIDEDVDDDNDVDHDADDDAHHELVKDGFRSHLDKSECSADVSVFKSLTAQRLMAGLSLNSIDTLVEVNAVAEARSKRQLHQLNESTETIDFGVI